MMTNKPPQKKASVKAMDYLARRDHSEKELREKLSQFYTEQEVDEAMEYVISHGWLLPPDEMAQKAAEALNRKSKSHFYILNFLRKKGLPPVDRDDDKEHEKALHVLELKAKDLSDYNHLHSLLKNRGFDTDTIRKVIDEVRTNTPSV
ncbi:MAG: regulatory protein RecX [Bdellovibrionales bacterium]|nr:recombination regulator RecX [Bdellovibrionales bacterium]NQZ19998.1 regulatory protein RecX [Bdellovibrionales bacterium]